jgi:uncharacterized protein YjiS (DUF1127 family)
MVLTSAFATLDDFRRAQMAAIHFEIPRRRLGAVPHHRGRAHDRAELASLDNRMLRDIGLTRADAEFLSNKSFWRE